MWATTIHDVHVSLPDHVSYDISTDVSVDMSVVSRSQLDRYVDRLSIESRPLTCRYIGRASFDVGLCIDRSIGNFIGQHYSRRENLMFIGIEEHNTMEQDEQGTHREAENTKEIIYKFMEEELQISNPRDKIEFQRIHRVGKPKHDGPRPIIARFLRYADREMVLHQARKTLKDKEFSVFEDIPKELYKLKKSQKEKFKDANDRGYNVYFSKRFPDKLYVNGKFIPRNAPL